MAREMLWSCGKFLAATEMLADWLKASLADSPLASDLAEFALIGLLETLWKHCHAAGDPFLGSERVVERAAGWPGERGVLFRILLECGGEGAGFIEADPDRAGYRVHDYYDHAPKHVRERCKRELARQEAGETIEDQKRRAARAMWEKKRLRLEARAGAEAPGEAPARLDASPEARGDASASPSPHPTPCTLHREEKEGLASEQHVLTPQRQRRAAAFNPAEVPLDSFPILAASEDFRLAWEVRCRERMEPGRRGAPPTESSTRAQLKDLERDAKAHGVASATRWVEKATGGRWQGCVQENGGNRPPGGSPVQKLAPGTTEDHRAKWLEFEQRGGAA